MTNRPNLVFVPLGGTGEIGMNCNLYGYGSGDARRDKGLSDRDWLMIDLGITFGRHHVPGIDVITPDLSFIEQRRASLKGLILTHGHEDHIGAVALLWPRLQCPIYTTAFTAELVRGKLAEHGLLDTVPLHVMEMNADLDLGPFHLQFIGLTHSIAEMQSVVIRCGETTVLHTGDWKFDDAPVIGAASNLSALSDLGEAGVDAIICDSTNVLQSGRAGSEADVGDALTELVKKSPGRVVITTFASNVARLASVGAAALATDRQVVLSGRGMHRIFEAARATGYLENFPSCVPEQEAGYLPPENTLILCTGSQGEHRAALRRMADGSHPHITLGPSDTVIFSSKMIPGNEVDILELHNDLIRAGVQVLTAQGGDFHVSGHPCRDELMDMYRRVKPRLAIPVHGEARHLDAHARLARELGVDHALVIENGDVVCLDPDDARVMGHVPVGRIHMDGHLAVPEDASAASVRRKLSHVGVVSIALAMDAGGRLCGAPEISLAGLPRHDEDGILMEDWVREAIDLAVPENGRVTQGRIEQDISRQVRRLCVQRWGKKPVIHVLLVAT